MKVVTKEEAKCKAFFSAIVSFGQGDNIVAQFFYQEDLRRSEVVIFCHFAKKTKFWTKNILLQIPYF
jgi:hypothetical protein